MKALILAAGRGKRLNEITENRNKCMLEVSGCPLIYYSLTAAAHLGVTEIVLVVGYMAEDIINTVGIRFNDIPVKYVIQREQRGLVHAMECAGATLAGDDFILMLGDEIMVNDRRQAMNNVFIDTGSFAMCGLVWRNEKTKELIRRTYALLMNDAMQVSRLIEKPRSLINNWQGTGNCIFKNAIIDYIQVCPIHYERGEKELPDLIQCAIDDGRSIIGFDVCDDYYNLNSVDDVEIYERNGVVAMAQEKKDY